MAIDTSVLSRTPAAAPWRTVAWDGRTLGAWASEVDGSDVVVNLAGRSVNCRYTRANRRDILESRIASTRVLGEAVAQASRPPKTWLQSSTATIYAHRYDAPNDEKGAQISKIKCSVGPEEAKSKLKNFKRGREKSQILSELTGNSPGLGFSSSTDGDALIRPA